MLTNPDLALHEIRIKTTLQIYLKILSDVRDVF